MTAPIIARRLDAASKMLSDLGIDTNPGQWMKEGPYLYTLISIDGHSRVARYGGSTGWLMVEWSKLSRCETETLWKGCPAPNWTSLREQSNSFLGWGRVRWRVPHLTLQPGRHKSSKSEERVKRSKENGRRPHSRNLRMGLASLNAAIEGGRE